MELQDDTPLMHQSAYKRNSIDELLQQNLENALNV